MLIPKRGFINVRRTKGISEAPVVCNYHDLRNVTHCRGTRKWSHYRLDKYLTKFHRLKIIETSLLLYVKFQLTLFSEIHWAYKSYRMEKNLAKQYTSYIVFY